MEKNLLNMEKIFVFGPDRYDVECVVAKKMKKCSFLVFFFLYYFHRSVDDVT
jgi:hypothetical protein